MRSLSFLVLVTLLPAYACSMPQREVKIFDLTTTHPSLVTYSTELRGAYLVPAGSALKFCAEPVPDVALSSLEKITASLKGEHPTGIKGDGALATEFSATVAELAGRTQLVLIAREMLFRACEFSVNHPGAEAQAQAQQMYDRVADVLVQLGQAQANNAAAARKTADAILNKAIQSGAGF